MASSFWVIMVRGFSVLSDFYSGFSVLMDFLAGFPVSDRSQCPPHFSICTLVTISIVFLFQLDYSFVFTRRFFNCLIFIFLDVCQ